MYSIGVFTNELSLQRILKLNDLLSQRSYITYLPYTSPDHLRFLYEENQGKFDALLFSGSYPYNVIRKFFPQVADVPHAYFDLSPVDYYKAIAALAIQHPGLDFTRVDRIATGRAGMLWAGEGMPHRFDACFEIRALARRLRTARPDGASRSESAGSRKQPRY